MPTLIERDNDVPALDVLLAEAMQADALLTARCSQRAAPAAPCARRAMSAQSRRAACRSAGGVCRRAARSRSARCPDGLAAWNGSDPAARFAVHRNNVVASLVDALAETFPVSQELVGEEFFRAMAKALRAAHRRRARCVLATYGDAFPAFVERFPPAQALPYLADVARLEMARVRAFHAADAQPVSAARLRRWR